MNNSIEFLGLVLGIVGAMGHAVCAGQPMPSANRWDLVMIKEAPIWKNLLKNYGHAPHEKYWPDRKVALEEVVSQYPNSQWADDAALILACAKADSENDTVGAIAGLQNVVKAYPNAQSIVVFWDPAIACVFDRTWLMWQGGLVFLNPDKTIRSAKPFDRHGEISQTESEALAYFEHLEKYPRSTKVTAQFFIAKMPYQKGDVEGAISALEKITSNSAGYLSTMVQADGVAALGPYGYHIRDLSRPEVDAYFDLIGLYEQKGQFDKAIAKGDQFASSVNNGPRWDIIKLLGKFYDGRNFKEKAKAQYQVALSVVEKYIEADKERSKHLEFIKPPTEQDLSPHLKREAAELESLISDPATNAKK